MLLLKKYRRSIISIGIFLILWQCAFLFTEDGALFLSSPLLVVRELYSMFSGSQIYMHLEKSLVALFVGLTLGLSFGVFIGVLLGYYPKIKEYLWPYVFFLNALPLVAIFPLIIIWFGIGIASKIGIIFIMTFVPIVISTMDGIESMPQTLRTMAMSFGASNMLIIRAIALPHALPHIFSGLRIAVGRGIVGLVIAEVFGYGKGIGYLVSFYGANFQITRLMAVVVVLLAISLLLTSAIGIIEKKILLYKK